MNYRVTDGFATVETAVGAGRARIDVPRGELLPADVPVEEVTLLLAQGRIEAVGTAIVAAAPAPVTGGDEVPAGTVDEVLTWVDADPARAAEALAAEQAKGEGARSTLVTKLTALADQ